MVEALPSQFHLREISTSVSFAQLPDGSVVQPNNGSYTDRVCVWLEVNQDGLITEIRVYTTHNINHLMDAARAAQREASLSSAGSDKGL